MSQDCLETGFLSLSSSLEGELCCLMSSSREDEKLEYSFVLPYSLLNLFCHLN